jgi:hypothetical protein
MGDALHRTVETCGVARNKEHFQIRIAAPATRLFRESHLQIDEAVCAANNAIKATYGSNCLGRLIDVIAAMSKPPVQTYFSAIFRHVSSSNITEQCTALAKKRVSPESRGNL